MKWDHKHWEALRGYHGRLGPESFWRLAGKYKDIERLLAALKEEALPRDSARGRLARVRTEREEWEAAALHADIARLEAWLRERRFEHRHWDRLRYYHDWLGLETFWRLAREHREFDDLTLALRGELRHELLMSLEESGEANSAPGRKALAGTGLIEIGATEDKPRKTTDSPR